MQVFSEPDHISNSEAPGHLDHRSSLEQVHHVGQTVDNTYATIQPRNNQNRLTGGGGAGGGSMRSGGGASAGGVGGAGLLLARVDPHMNEFADYATLRNNRAPSVRIHQSLSKEYNLYLHSSLFSCTSSQDPHSRLPSGTETTPWPS